MEPCAIIGSQKLIDPTLAFCRSEECGIFFHVFMRRYSLRYQGWDSWEDQEHTGHNRRTGAGHLTIVSSFECDSNKIELLDESVIESYDGFIQQLSLFGGNVLEMVKAAAVHH